MLGKNLLENERKGIGGGRKGRKNGYLLKIGPIICIKSVLFILIKI